MGDYYGMATATVFSGANTYEPPVGQYAGNGKVNAMIYTTDGVRAAFDATFVDLANRMLADPRIAERLRAEPPR